MVCSQSGCNCTGWVVHKFIPNKCQLCGHLAENHSEASQQTTPTKPLLGHSPSTGDLLDGSGSLRKRGVSPAPSKEAPTRPRISSPPLTTQTQTTPLPSYPTSPTSPTNASRQAPREPPPPRPSKVNSPNEPVLRPSSPEPVLRPSSPEPLASPSRTLTPSSEMLPTPRVPAKLPLNKSSSFSTLPDGPSRPPPMRPAAMSRPAPVTPLSTTSPTTTTTATPSRPVSPAPTVTPTPLTTTPSRPTTPTPASPTTPTATLVLTPMTPSPEKPARPEKMPSLRTLMPSPPSSPTAKPLMSPTGSMKAPMSPTSSGRESQKAPMSPTSSGAGNAPASTTSPSEDISFLSRPRSQREVLELPDFMTKAPSISRSLTSPDSTSPTTGRRVLSPSPESETRTETRTETRVENRTLGSPPRTGARSVANPPRLAPSNAETKKAQQNDTKDWVEFFDSNSQSLFVNMVNRGTFMDEDVHSMKQARRARADSKLFQETWTHGKEERSKDGSGKSSSARETGTLRLNPFVEEEVVHEEVSPEKINAILMKMQASLSIILNAPLFEEHKLPLERGRAILEDSLLLSAPRNVSERLAKRRAVLASMCELEQSFVEQSQLLADQFFDPLSQPASVKTYGPIAQEPKLGVLSFLLKNLHDLHAKLAAELKHRLEHWNEEQCIGDLLSVWGNQYYRLHAQYAKDYPEVRAKMERCASSNATFGHHFRDAKFARTSAEFLLDCPMFHVARMGTLLKRLLRITDRTHGDFSDLEKAYMTALASQETVDEATWVSSTANAESLLQLIQQFDSPPELPNKPRRLIKEGRLCMIVPKFGPKFFYFHLLSDTLLYSTIQEEQSSNTMAPPKTVLSLVRACDLTHVTLKRFPTDPTLSPKTSFSLVYQDEVLAIQTRNQHDKRGWVTSIRKAIEMARVRGKGATSVVVVPGTPATKKCMLCQKEFSMTRRKHHCRGCGKMVCGACSITKTVSSKAIRVCRTCASTFSTTTNIAPIEASELSDEEPSDEESQSTAHRNSKKGMERSGTSSNLSSFLGPNSAMTSQPSSRELLVPAAKSRYVDVNNQAHIRLCKQDPHYALLHELIENEAEYVADLELLTGIVVKPMLAIPELLPKAKGGSQHMRSGSTFAELAKLNEDELVDLRQLLELVQPIYVHNQGILSKLVDKANPQTWNQRSTANDIIMQSAAGFSHYASYTQTHWRVDQILNNKLGNLLSYYDRLLRDKSTKEKTYTARLLLRLPTLRLTQYIFYFQQLVSLSAPGQSTYGPSLALMQKNNSTSVSTVSMKERLIKLESRFASGRVALAIDGRVLLKEGVLSRVTRRGIRSYYFHLLNDLLLYSDVLKTGAYNLHHIFELGTVTISEPAGSPYSHAIQFSSPQKSFLIVCDTKDDKVSWESALQKCITECKRTGPKDGSNLAPVWTQDQHGVCCTLCQFNFTAIKRRHHCRACGALVCNQCSKTKQLLVAVDKRPVRICDNCARLHNNSN